MISATLAPFLLKPGEFSETFLKIRSRHDVEIPFDLNPAQRILLRKRSEVRRAGKKPRFIVLKARKEGVTTLVQALAYWRVCTRENAQAVTLGPERETTEKIFEVADRFYASMSADVRPRRLTEHNKKTLDFPGMRSSYYIGTAGKKSFGRGSTISFYHGTEVAFWPGTKNEQENLLAGLDEAATYGEGWLESTPNGFGNLFHTMWEDTKAGGSVWTPIFLPWWDDPTYAIGFVSKAAREEFRASLTDEEKELADRHKLSLNQIQWRREKQKERKRLFIQEFPEDDTTCFILSGSCFFDRLLLNAMRLNAPEPGARKRYDDLGISDLRIWANPQPGRRYCAGADVAEGTPSGNHSVCAVIDVQSLDPVAVLRGKWKPDEFAKRSARLCEHFNMAMLAVERNNHGHSALNTLVNGLDYPNLYFHLEYDAVNRKERQVLGWPTTPKTRPIMIDRLRDAIESGEMKAVDKVLLAECMNFVRPDGEPDGKYEAAEGTEDDSIFAYSVALQCRERALSEGGNAIPTTYSGIEQAIKAQAASHFPKQEGSLFNGG